MATTGSEIIQNLLYLMVRAANFDGMSGELKKAFVVREMRAMLNFPEPIEDLIASMIDLLISVDKNKIRINPKAQSLFACC